MLPVSKLDKLENVKIKEVIEGYFNELNRKNRDYSDKANGNRTATTYESDIRQYFHWKGKPKGMELEYLTQDDISIDQDMFETYLETLYEMTDENGELKYKNKTILKKISSLKGIIKYLKKKRIIDIDISYLEYIKGDKARDSHYGCLEVNEVFHMAELARNERDKGEIKRLLILFALDTCIRKSALLNLKWSNFVEREDGVMVQGVDKGNKEFRQLISRDFYNQLLTIKSEKTDKVFDVSGRRVNDMMSRLLEQMEIDPERRIVFHSIRKAGVSYRYRLTNDILEAQRAANHSNVNTTMIYLQSEDYGSIGAVSGAGSIDDDLYKKVDHDVLIQALEDCKKDMLLILNMKINDILKNGNDL